jgi:glutamate/tyrosine decarboxylase-like PLP-dependent enzyme
MMPGGDYMSATTVYGPVLQGALEHALTYLEALEAGPVSASATLEELRGRLCLALGEQGLDPRQVIDELAAGVQGGLLSSAGGRFFAWVMGGSVPAALAADWLTSTWDQNAALYACSPAEAVIEEACGAWLKDLLGLPESAGFALTTGCQMAHATCLAAARHALLAQRGWDVERKGLQGAPRLHVLCNSQSHGSVERSLRFLGLGSECARQLPVNAEGQLEPEILAAALRELVGEPVLVLLCAGDINLGAFDPFDDLIPLAHAHGAWVHVDGAFGLWVQASPRYRHLLKGVEGADSWATDGHKWLNVPYDCGYAFVADTQAHRAAMSLRASYLVHAEEARDPFDWNLEWSRRGRGVATYAAIRQLGRNGIADLVERCCRHAHALVAGIGALEGAEVMWEPRINQGLVRFPDPRPGATEADHDARTDRVIAGILATGRTMVGGTTWRGRRCMRISVCNWQTSEADVATTIAAVDEVLRDLLS